MRANRHSLLAGIGLLLLPATSTRVAPLAGDTFHYLSTGQAQGAPPRARTLFDFDWRFHAGEAENAQAPGASDAGWDRVDLPHDFMIAGKGQAIVVPGEGAGGERAADLPTEPEGPFDPRSPGASDAGFLNAGIGWYRKTFTLPAGDAARRVFLEFEGVYMNSELWLNGEKLGTRPYGYSTFEYELTPHLKFGAPNVLAVRVLVRQPSSRWYSGAGIYRHVWLTVTHPVHIEHWGIFARTTGVSAQQAQVSVRVEVRNQSAAGVTAEAEVTIRDRAGRAVATQRSPGAIGADGQSKFELSLAVPRPHRWSIGDPYLYSVDARIRAGGRVVDEGRVAHGIRTIAFTPDSGFLLNGVRVPLHGVCLHHDLGPLGAAAFDRGIERQLEIMKQMGVNAIRTSHNPPAPALLDLADRMGFVVMDEVFDEWKRNKTRFGYGLYFDEWSERDTRDMVRRDRNHASVVMWSIGNEIPEQGDTLNAEPMARRLAGFVRDEDPTRFVTAGMDNPTAALRTGFAKPLDLFGVNYHLNVYPTVRGMKAYGSETSSDYSSRDQYNLVLKDGVPQVVNRLNNHVTSYDFEGPSWGNNAETQFQAMRGAPWMAGEFVWTGFDYIGEPTPFGWPNRSSSFGIVDLVGFRKDRFYLYQSQWRPEPMVHILPHWNWPAEFRGKPIPVWTYTNADSVELFLNGRSLGVRDWTGVKETHLAWQVPYEPGTLRAVARRRGRVVAEDRVETTGAPQRLELIVDHPTIRPDGQDLAYVTVRVVDARGRLSRSDGNQLVRFTLTGTGSIAAVDNGDPTNHEPFSGPAPNAARHRAFNGLAMVVIRAPRAGGTITLRAQAEGLAKATVRIRVQ
jgi:beta-galactosidase